MRNPLTLFRFLAAALVAAVLPSISAQPAPGQIQSVQANNSTGALVSPSAFSKNLVPPMASQSGKLLGTDGTTAAWQAAGSGSGTVQSASVVTANGISATVANPTTTPAFTFTLGAITPTSVNGLTISTSTGTLAITNAKVFSVANTLTLSGTDGSTLNVGTGGTLGASAFLGVATRAQAEAGTSATVLMSAQRSGQVTLRNRWLASEYRTRAVTPLPLMAIGPTITRTGTSASLTGTLVDPTSTIFRYGGAYWEVAGASSPDNGCYNPKYGASGSSLGSGCIEFSYFASSLELLVKEFAGTGFRVWVNNELAGVNLTTTQTSSGTMVYYKIDFGSAALRQIKIEGNGQFFFGGIKPKDTSSAVYPATAPRQPRVIVMGDSYVQGTDAAGGYYLSGFPKILGSIMDWDVWASGVGGTGWLVATTIRSRLANDVYANAPDIVIFCAGHNDTSSTSGQIQTEVGLVLTGMAANLPNTKIYVIGPLYQTSPAAAGIIAVRDGMSAAAAAAGVTYIDTVTSGSEWITSGTASTFISGDNVHPNSAGHLYYAHRFASAIMSAEGY